MAKHAPFSHQLISGTQYEKKEMENKLQMHICLRKKNLPSKKVALFFFQGHSYESFRGLFLAVSFPGSLCLSSTDQYFSLLLCDFVKMFPPSC